MHDAECLGLVHWDDPEGWFGEGGGRRVQDGKKKQKKEKKKKKTRKKKKERANNARCKPDVRDWTVKWNKDRRNQARRQNR